MISKFIIRTGEFGTKISNEIFPTEPIICIKEFAYGSPKFLTGTFLNANIFNEI